MDQDAFREPRHEMTLTGGRKGGRVAVPVVVVVGGVQGWLAVMGRYGVFTLSPCNVTPTLTLLLAVFHCERVAPGGSACKARGRGRGGPNVRPVLRMRLWMVHYLSRRGRPLAADTGFVVGNICVCVLCPKRT